MWHNFVAEVKAGILSRHRTVLIRNFGDSADNDLLLHLATGLGRPYKDPKLPNRLMEDEIVFRVECVGEGIRDSRGVVLYSTTNARFPSHTDGSGKPNPYDVVLLYCARQGICGGDSTLITLDELVNHLDLQSLKILRTNSFPFTFGVAPIICGRGRHMWIRYNAEELSFYCRRRRMELDGDQKKALANVAATLSMLENRQPKVRMASGQCLVLDNKRVLHGRTAFSAEGNRLLKRVRLYWA